VVYPFAATLLPNSRQFKGVLRRAHSATANAVNQKSCCVWFQTYFAV